ncbi:MAG TPA: SUMF1/EgtB/PvdO family nonheme iron enzyme [Xanthobacteraceae bacterium]|nr:SUMF1/EgtB/PvdO family nonheme iron enzyme [Xanthobacteraceae bacterium]
MFHIRRLLVCPLALLIAAIFSLPAMADKRVALVVGNGSYTHVPPLDNPSNDGRLLAEALRSIGFTLVGGGAQLNLDKQSFEKVVQEFGAKLQGADVGLFYYAGHGLQMRGINYLVPVDANPTREADVGIQMLDANLILNQMEGTGTKLNIVILDACRNDPFSGRALLMGRGRDNEMVKMRDIAGGGLAEMHAPEGTLIAFATQPGNTALDGADGDSPYTKALAETIREPGLGIFEMFNRVGVKVKNATKSQQLPWTSNSPIEGAFYFVPPQVAVAGPAAAPVAKGPSAEEIAWDYLKDTADVASLRRFVTKFPQGPRKHEAEVRIATLEQAAAEAQRVQSAQPKAAAPVQKPTLLGQLSPEQERALKPPERFKECETCPEMVTVPAGAFLMGSPASEPARGADEGPQQQVAFGHTFAVARSAVTFDEWNACVAEGGCNAYRPGDYGWGGGKRPVINVSWNDAQAYVKWLSAKTGALYRLLSEAEREYVSRGCTSPACPSTPFWFGAEISPDRANYDWRFSYAGSAKAQPPRRTVATDASDPNPFGLLQVHGNVREWVEDCWNANLSGLSPDGKARTTGDCESHVVRGGSWADEPKDLRSAKRSWEVTTERRAQIGFRVARTLRE